jgi:CO/xanthine dehydrogenase Mo-binding subunit
MTEILNRDIVNREFSRKSFLQGGGALVVGFSMLGAGLGAKAAKGAVDPYESKGPYDQQAIDSWLAIHADNTVTLKPGKVELGQGTLTGLLMIAAEELDVSMAQMKYAGHDTNVTANQGATVGSQGIQTGGMQVRAAAAAAKDALLGLAATNLGVAKASLSVTNGVVSGGGRTVPYGALLGDKLFNVRNPVAFSLASGAPGTKPISGYKIVGKTGQPRVDIPDKVTGKYVYVHNVKVPGMLHGRVVRPRGQGAYGDGTSRKILSIDESSIKKIPDVQIVRFNDFLGVVAPTEYGAIQAAAQLKVKWADAPTLPGVGNLWKQMRGHDSSGQAPARITVNNGNFDAAYASAPIKASQSYSFHYTGHLPIGPGCVVADVTPNGARIFSSTQDAYGTRQNIKDVLDVVMSKPLALDRIRVTYYEGASNYGSAPYRDTAQAAAIMSAIVGKPVRVQFMRWDEHGWDNYGPAQLTDVRGAVDANGKLIGMEYTALGQVHFTTNSAEQQVKSGAASFAGLSQLDGNISGSQYNLANRKVVGKTLPLQNNYFKVTFLRAPNALQSSFAAEQLVDELAYAAKMDPYQFRLQNVAATDTDPQQRWKNALMGVAKLSNWKPKVAASNLSSANVVTGRGIAFGQFANSMSAAVVDVEVNKKSGKILVKNAYCCTDNGFVVYPEGVHNNEEGAVMQGISRSVYEQVVFDKQTVTSLDWVTYPMIRFKDAPKVYFQDLSRTDVPQTATSTVAASGSRSTGAGEPGLAPMSAAIANAFFDATGVRIREAPMTPGRVRAVLKAAGK